nr:hypothetical protein [Streptomyces albus]
MGASGAVLLAAGCSSGPDGHDVGPSEGSRPVDGPEGALGANFNEDADSVTFNELRDLSACWLRGFVPLRELPDEVAEQAAVKKLLAAHRDGYGTVLSLKFPFNHRSIPEPGSAAMAVQLSRVDKVLESVLDSVDVLAIGNEPFIESLPEDRRSGALNSFYEKVATHVIAYREKHFPKGCRTRLYMGALNHLDQPDKRTEATGRWLSFVRATPQIEGVDIHPHVSSPQGAQAYLDYILPRLRKDQKFLVTEFSLVQLWEQHLSDPVPAGFARKYRIPQDTPVWKLIRDAIEQPMPAGKWRDFLSMSPWFESHQHFLRNQVRAFRRTGRLAVATYGVSQAAAMTEDFGPRKQPWLLNSLYSNRTVEPSRDGLPARSYGFFDDFRALQREQDRRPVRWKKVPT